MSETVKDRMIGVVVTIASSLIMFLAYNYTSSFETKASSETKYHVLNKKLDLVLCYLDKKYCIKEDK